MQRPVALRADRGRERMIVGLGVVADHLDLLLDEPLAGGRHEAGRAAEIVLAVLVELVPAGVDDDDVARAHDLAGGLFEIVVGDLLPFLLRDRHHDAGAEEVRQRHLVDERRALHDMRRRVDMGGVVHGRGDALRQHAGLRHVVDALDLDVLEIRPVRRLVAEAMGQVVELEPHRVVEVLLERHAADLLRQNGLPERRAQRACPRVCERAAPACGTPIAPLFPGSQGSRQWYISARIAARHRRALAAVGRAGCREPADLHGFFTPFRHDRARFVGDKAGR